MKEFAAVRWRDLIVVFVFVTAILVTASLLRGDGVLSSTAITSLPIAAVVCALSLAYVKRRYRD